jgi:hypothetical protein
LGRCWAGFGRFWASFTLGFLLGGEGSLRILGFGVPRTKSFVLGFTIDLPGAPGGVFDLKRQPCGHDRRCTIETLSIGQVQSCRSVFGAKWVLEAWGAKAQKPHMFPETSGLLALPPSAARPTNHSLLENVWFLGLVTPGLPEKQVANKHFGTPLSTDPTLKSPTLVFVIHDFGAGRQSSILGVWAAPAAPKTIPEGGGLRPPPFGLVVEAAGAAHSKPCVLRRRSPGNLFSC